MDLSSETTVSLLSKLETADDKLNDSNENNDVAAVNQLDAFINKVEARRGTELSDDEADALIEWAQLIKDRMGS
jgi:hypothetical protein